MVRNTLLARREQALDDQLCFALYAASRAVTPPKIRTRERSTRVATGVPGAGDALQVVSDIERAQDIANQRQMQARQATDARTAKDRQHQMDRARAKQAVAAARMLGA